MAHIINLPSFHDPRGSLTVIERVVPFDIKRIFYLYDTKEIRGGHRHKKTRQALIVLNGSCEVIVNNNIQEEIYLLDSPAKCLLIEPEDWHTMDKFTEGSVLLVLASELYNREDYIEEEYIH